MIYIRHHPLAIIRLTRLHALNTAKAEIYSAREGYWRGFADGLKYAECVLEDETPKDDDFVGVRSDNA